jgi:hypothetical protein
MNWGFIAVSGVLVLLGLVCLWFRHKFREEVAVMAATPTSRAADVKTLAPGSVVEVKGTIRCAAPLTGEFSKRPCVYVRSVVERKETRWRDGKRETYYTNERTTELHAPFEVEDDSGRVPVRGQGASVEAVEVFNESGNTGVDTAVSVVLAVAGAGSHERRFKESILAPDIPVYVLGSVVEGGAIGAPPQGAKIKEFIITHKTEEERARSSTTTATILLVVGCVLFAGAVASLVAAFVYRVN